MAAQKKYRKKKTFQVNKNHLFYGEIFFLLHKILPNLWLNFANHRWRAKRWRKKVRLFFSFSYFRQDEIRAKKELPINNML